jgi:hypothetical protein
MNKLAVALLCCALAGCAGTATYSVEPFYQPDLKQMVCCRASAQNGKDISSLTFDLSMTPGNTITVHFSELGVGATAPITAQSQATTAIAGAVSSAAAAAIKLAP